MPIWLHSTLQIIGEILAFCGGALLTFFLIPEDSRQSAGAWLLLPMFCSSFLGVMLIRSLASKIAVRCPKCRGQSNMAFQWGMRPFRSTYTCQACGHVQVSRIRTNW